ncbi:MAG: BRO-N domain-containing protein [Asticcacaulis sp.]|uniref:BRO-N domain-containing protein n=1 Tax=Asticcacaulis sp. TaxID=1872648 RepID=UPI003F7B6F19
MWSSLTTSTETATIFTFQPTEAHAPVNIRTTLIDGEPWFVAMDVMEALALRANRGTNSVIYNLPDIDKKVVLRISLHPNEAKRPGNPRLTLISEPAVYRLITKSDRPEAKVFQDWLFREVLPSIRKTGAYSLADHGREAMPLPMDIAEAVAKAIAPLEAKIESLTALIEGLKVSPESDRMLTAAAALKLRKWRGVTNPRNTRAWNKAPL